MLNKKMVLFLCFLLLAMTSCFEYNERLIINEDGSGKLEVEYWGYSDSDMDFNDKEYWLSEDDDDIRRNVKKNFTARNVKLDKFRVRDRGEKRYVNFTVKFKNVKDLNRTRYFRKNGEIDFDIDNGEIVVEREFLMDEDHDFSRSDNWFEAFVKETVKENVLDEILFEFEIELPYKIKNSNSKRKRGKKTAFWRYSLSDFQERGDVVMRVSAEK